MFEATFVFLFFKQKPAYEVRIRDWSSDVCSSDLMAREIEGHAPAEAVAPEERVHRPDDFRALVVDRRRVEVVDLDVLGRAHRMRGRSGILGKLARAQRADLTDALDRRRARRFGELLIAEDRQALLQAELKPVATGDAVAGPVVEVFVRDDGFDETVIRRSEENTSELQSLMRNSSAVFCLK